MKHAWDNYEKYAWGANELRPISKRGHSASIFGSLSLGATIIDAADTLYVMELMDEYKKARDWIATSFNFDGVGEPLLLMIVIMISANLFIMHIQHMFIAQLWC